MSTEENKQVARRVVDEIFNQGQLQMIDDLVAEDYRLNDPPGLPPGRDGILTLTRLYRSGFPDLQISVENVIGEGDHVALRWSGTGTHSGMFMGLPPTGQQVRVRGLTWLLFREGKVAEEWTQVSSPGTPR